MVLRSSRHAYRCSDLLMCQLTCPLSLSMLQTSAKGCPTEDVLQGAAHDESSGMNAVFTGRDQGCGQQRERHHVIGRAVRHSRRRDSKRWWQWLWSFWQLHRQRLRQLEQVQCRGQFCRWLVLPSMLVRLCHAQACWALPLSCSTVLPAIMTVTASLYSSDRGLTCGGPQQGSHLKDVVLSNRCSWPQRSSEGTQA